MYFNMLRNDEEPAPHTGGAQVNGYTRQAYNGMNILQVFAANSLL